MLRGRSQSDDSRTYVGVDIIRSGGRALSDYVYAIAIVRQGKLVKVDKGNLGRLIRYLWDSRPSALATDNIFEIGGSKKNLIRLLKLVPPDTEFIQITLDEAGFRRVKNVAFNAGIQVERGKLSPMRTAVLAAMLAWSGHGSRLNVFERKVKINVFKGRSGSAGGSRSSKYQRNLRAAVARVVRKIREELERRGIDYDVMIRRSRGGVESAVFTVYASREELFGVVSRMRGYDVEVRIKPVVNRKFLNLRQETPSEKPYLIVGYDPGMQVGLAAIDLFMRPKLVTSGRELDRGNVINVLSSVGVPVMIATDKNPPPEMVRKLAAALRVQIYVPRHSLSTTEKELIVNEYCRKFGIRVKNTHERDALSAALKAYRVYEEKLRKLLKKVKSMGLSIKNIQQYQRRILSNEPLSTIIEDIINDYFRKPRQQARKILAKDATALERELVSKYREMAENLRRTLDEVTAERDALRIKLENAIRDVEKLRRELDTLKNSLNLKLLKERKVSELMTRLKNANEKIQELEQQVLSLREALRNSGKVIERVFAGELSLIPKFGAKVFTTDQVNTPLYVEDKVTLLKVLGDNINERLREGGIIVPPGLLSDAEIEGIVRKFRVPVAVAREVWPVSACLVAVDTHVHEMIESSKNLIQSIVAEEERRRRLTYEDLMRILTDYRRNRLSADERL